MIRPITLITALLFVLSGAYLFAVKHHAQMLDDQLTATAQATRLDAQRIRVLQAQWALEVDPSRLAQLSTQFMSTLQPMKPSQLVTLAALTSALPAPGSAAPGANPEDAVPSGNPGDAVPAMPLASAGAADANVASLSSAPANASVTNASVTNASVSHASGAPAGAAVTLAAAHTAVRSTTWTPARLARSAPRQTVRLASVEALLHKLPDGRRAIRARHAASHAADHEYAENRPSYEAQMGSSLAPQSIAPQLSAVRVPQAPMGAQVMSVRAVSTPAPMPMGGGSMLGMAQGDGN
jgi:hypothetical protein